MDNRDQQIQQMCDFIIQEAKEKVNEIRLKTAHDSNLEKQMTIHNAKNKIQKEFKDKEKQLHMEKRITISRAEEEYRVKKMVVRQELLDALKEKALASLSKVTNDKKAYEAMLGDLMVQGLIKLNEPKVDVIVRECDLEIAKKVKTSAEQKYSQIIKDQTGQSATVSLTLNPNGKCLPPASDGSGKKSCAGGLKLLASRGRIICDNTLDSRMAVSFDDLMPYIRSTLFSDRV
mmetsp:Transcript_9699/g.15917  ORF Transcript_9699/g.15917 Transcript_9699/m.15917 type:complete len:232 (-) Transcript_9699:37-732(-)|eukprot:CAMPEP_0203747746 /NCGR_PEP_ID=MMETSP0098-20131031/2814_1 /ASSEMBLY_ACC=CAM_ASM_000208 /TAXON_ID=96639 /ORGANISM=" , Strain NY0313808BC1" /LENGTH=231 /DNA_ID=CAMNT_0050636279 /DNA_START=2279 /DNA_END=2974 /DNA_ORIENTATION=-